MKGSLVREYSTQITRKICPEIFLLNRVRLGLELGLVRFRVNKGKVREILGGYSSILQLSQWQKNTKIHHCISVGRRGEDQQRWSIVQNIVCLYIYIYINTRYFVLYSIVVGLLLADQRRCSDGYIYIHIRLCHYKILACETSDVWNPPHSNILINTSL